MTPQSFSGDSLEGFLISGSMVGLTLIIAVYSITMPRMKDVFNRQVRKLKAFVVRQTEIIEKLRRDKDNETLASDLQTIQQDIKRIKKLPFHLDLGYQISGLSFAGALITPLLKLLFPDDKVISLMAEGMVIYFIVGIISFLIVWFMVFIEFRSYATEEFQKALRQWKSYLKADTLQCSIDSQN